jgi:AMP deaminase
MLSIVGFDTVDDESVYEEFKYEEIYLKPDKWVSEKNPHYAYYLYYLYANV